MTGRAIVLYDGVCAFCNGVVRFVLHRDPVGRFRFASLQSDFAKALLRRHGLEAASLDTFYVVLDPDTPSERVLARSDAALMLLPALGGPWKALAAFRVLPAGLRDALYGVVARNRYRLFGRHDVCELPRPEWRERFIEV
ncbi:MAG: DUF393 domain-containing protein [Deltaproteobacteria bacterium]|nr:DUF393 domain-containing protein [Deltaproteobacteria bacterium]